MFKIIEVSGKTVPGASVTFYFKRDDGVLVNPIVTLISDNNGMVKTNDMDLFTSDKVASVDADGYGQTIVDTFYLKDGGFVALEKIKSGVPWWVFLLPVVLLIKYINKK